MKIGILTVYSVANFGSYLQALALKQTLESFGHEVYHIKIRTTEEIRKGFYKYPVTRRSLQHPIEEYQKFVFGRKKYTYFKECLDVFNEIEQSDISKMDCIIIGSDELWNISEAEFQHPLYFGDGIKHTMTYGISIGKAKMSDFDIRPKFKQFIKNVDYITVRDYRTQDVIENIIGSKPPMVCDPTFLVDTKKLKSICNDEYIRNNKYLLLYTYNFTINEWTKEYVIKYAKEKGLKLVSAGFYFSWCDYNLNCSPMEFCDVIERAECMVTTTFHGCVLGALNHQNVLAVPFSPKVDDVMGKLGFSKWVINEKCDYERFKSQLDDTSQNWKYAYEYINTVSKSSLELIKNMLSY